MKTFRICFAGHQLLLRRKEQNAELLTQQQGGSTGNISG